MKKLLCGIMAIMLCLIVVGVTGCGEDKTQKQLEEVQAQLQQITEKLNELQSENKETNDKLNTLQEENKETNEKLNALQEENNTINDRLSELEFVNAKGTFYSILEAYDKGLLTKTDLKDVCYYRFGQVWEGEDLNSEEWTKVEYTPTRTLSALDKKIETKIKEAYYELNEDQFYNKDGDCIGGIDDLTVRFFGEFNNSYVVRVECSLWGYPGVVIPMIVAGLAWWESVEFTMVFRVE